MPYVLTRSVTCMCYPINAFTCTCTIRRSDVVLLIDNLDYCNAQRASIVVGQPSLSLSLSLDIHSSSVRRGTVLYRSSFGCVERCWRVTPGFECCVQTVSDSTTPAAHFPRRSTVLYGDWGGAHRLLAEDAGLGDGLRWRCNGRRASLIFALSSAKLDMKRTMREWSRAGGRAGERRTSGVGRCLHLMFVNFIV